jgi:hypothetical protein
MVSFIYIYVSVKMKSPKRNLGFSLVVEVIEEFENPRAT